MVSVTLIKQLRIISEMYKGAEPNIFIFNQKGKPKSTLFWLLRARFHPPKRTLRAILGALFKLTHCFKQMGV